MNKSSLQQKEYESLKNEKRVILKWATGMGKSKVAIDLLSHLSENKPKTEVLLLVAERSHISNWEDEFRKWNLDKSKFDISIKCYASLHKLVGMKFDAVVMDEAHHACTPKRLEILETMQAEYVYLLSATFSHEKLEALEDIFGRFTVNTVSLKTAISNNFLPEPKVIIMRLTLDDSKPNMTIKYGEGDNLPTVDWNDRYQYIRKKQPCLIRCTERQKYVYYTNEMEYWKERYQRSHNAFQHNKWVSLGSIRKRFLGELKTPYVNMLLEKLKDRKRFICFCASVSQAEDLGSKNAISSRRRDNQKVIDKFNAKKSSSLYAVGMATEGLNLTDIEAGVIVQLDGKERLFIQKFGRSLRAEDPVTYILYYANTQDEKYLEKALNNIDEKYIKRINVTPLNLTKA